MLPRALKFIKTKFAFLSVFGIAKFVVYFSPLLLADILTEYDYGVVEYALSGLGIWVASSFSLGINGAYPYFILKKEDTEKENAFSIHGLWLIFLFLINQLLYYIFNLYEIKIYLALNFSYIFANQLFYSAKLKTKDSLLKAVLIDSGVYFILLLFIISVFFNFIKTSISNLSVFVFGYSFIYVFYSLFVFYRINKTQIIKRYKAVLKFSYHILISSILIFTITVAGRLLTEYFFDTETVGVYGFYLRLASIVVVIHQVVNILFFKRLYTFNPKILDKYFSIFFICIYLISIMVYLISPYILPHIFEYYRKTFLDNKLLFFILSSQMIMWIASALNSSIVDREELAKSNNKRLLVLIIISILVLVLLKDILTLPLLAFIHFFVFYFATMIQYFTLTKKKIYFKKATVVLSTTFLITVTTVLLIYFNPYNKDNYKKIILNEADYILDDTYPKSDARRYGLTAKDAGKIHLVSGKNRLNTVLDIAEATGEEMIFPKGNYNMSLILDHRRNLKLRFNKSEFHLVHITQVHDSLPKPRNIEIKGTIVIYDRLGMTEANNIKIDSAILKSNIKKNLRNKGCHIYHGCNDIKIGYLEVQDIGSGSNFYKNTHAALAIDGNKNNPKNVTINKLYIKSTDRHGVYITGNNHLIKEIIIDKFGMGSSEGISGMQNANNDKGENKEFTALWINKCSNCNFKKVTINEKESKGKHTVFFDHGNKFKPSTIDQLIILNDNSLINIKKEFLTNVELIKLK
jgi:O-antigen/teichoic acid export membrane protein